MACCGAVLSPEFMCGSIGASFPGGKAASVCKSMFCSAPQVQWSSGQASCDAFWGAKMLLEFSGGSLS